MTDAHGDDTAIARLDAAVSAALSVVGKDATSQLRVLEAFAALAGALPEGGLLQALVLQSQAERQAAFVAFHERQIAAARGATALQAAWDESIAFAVGVGGEGAEVAALRERRPQGLHAGDVAPRPFFARFLEHQKR